MIGVVLSVAVFGVYAIWYQSKQPTFTLYKNQWDCAETRVYYTQTTILVGKVMVPQTTRNVECINYVRK
jgi:hypothetical protein